MNLYLDKSTWKSMIFGEVVANVNDYYNADLDGVLPYVAGPHINAGEPTVARYGSTDDDKFPPTFKRKFQPGDVLLHSRGIEKLVSVDRVGVTGEKLFILRTKDEHTIAQEFLVWLLKSPQAQAHIRDNFTGSVNKFINWKPLALFEFDVPPIDEQKRIADLLWAVERHRVNMTTVLHHLTTARDQLNEVTFRRWMASATTDLENLYDFQIGKRLSPEGRARGGDPFPYITNFNVQWRHIDFSEVREMAFLEREQPIYEIKPGDVLACEARFVGRSAVWPDGRPGHMYQMSLHRLRHRDGELRPHMLVEFLDWCARSGYFKRLVGDNLIPHLPEVRFRKVAAPRPSSQEARAFEARHEAFASAISGATAEISAVAALSASLLAEIFGDN